MTNRIEEIKERLDNVTRGADHKPVDYTALAAFQIHCANDIQFLLDLIKQFERQVETLEGRLITEAVSVGSKRYEEGWTEGNAAGWSASKYEDFDND